MAKTLLALFLMPQVLIIDDEKHIRSILRTILLSLGFKVKVAQDGRQGIELFEDGCQFDLVITDIRMPEINGNQVAKHIRGSDNSGIPIIAISGYNKEIDKRLFDFSIDKPFRLETITDVIEKLKRERRIC